MNRTLAASALVGGLAAAAVPIAALVSLPAAEYGDFSVLYLVYAFVLSVQLSLVCDTWLRTRSRLRSSWSAYSAAGLATAVLGLATVEAVGVELGMTDMPTPLLALAACGSLWRNAARYHAMAEGRFRRLIVSDAITVAAFASAFAWGVRTTSPLVGVAVGWLALAVAGLLALPLPRLAWSHGPVSWIRERRAAIAPLLADSLLMDIGAIGAPLVVAGVLGASEFGVFRAVSSVALPVRVVIDPLRGAIASIPLRAWRRPSAAIGTVGGAAVSATATWIALTYVVPALPFDGGALADLPPYALPVATFVFASVIGQVAYIAARGGAHGRRLLLGRLTQTALVFAVPLCLALVGGVSAAIWGYALAVLFSSLAWVAVVLVPQPAVFDGHTPMALRQAGSHTSNE